MGSNCSFDLVCLNEVSSTNEVLLRASFDQYPLGTALLARRQSQGRGRADRRWVSSLGGMYLSALFLPSLVEGLTLLGALCVIRICREDLGVPALLRWPNDVYHEGRKLAGVLPQVKFCGHEVERAVLGVGLNVNQPPESFPGELRAVTLSQLCPGRPFDVESMAKRYLELLSQELVLFERDGCAALALRCQEYLEASGRAVGVSTPDGEVRRLGTVTGLGAAGELLFSDGARLSQLGVQERLAIL